MKVDLKNSTSSKVASKIEDMPDFWDGDYNFFWAKDIAFYGIDNLDLPFYKEKHDDLEPKISEENCMKLY